MLLTKKSLKKHWFLRVLLFRKRGEEVEATTKEDHEVDATVARVMT
jgi:hypothetical protein